VKKWNLRHWLIEPRVRSLDPDSADMTLAHLQVVQSKAMLRQLFEGFYRECREMDLRYFNGCPGRRMEIGSGAGFMKNAYCDVMTSDTKDLPFVDAVLRAEHMPFPDQSLRAIYAINVFHHLPNPRAFFSELLRVLHTGGGVVFIEPYYGFLARRLFKNLHEAEGFDPEVPKWEQAADMGPAAGANQAQSYIVFKRDRVQFDLEFPELELVLDKPHTHLLYFISGGVNFRQLAPDSFAPLVKLAEQTLAPLNRWIAIQHTIVLRRR
jgi:SAM-dependent methyltransferase